MRILPSCGWRMGGGAAAQGTPGAAGIVAWAEESRAWVGAPCDSVAERPLNGLAAENEPRAVRDGAYRHGPQGRVIPSAPVSDDRRGFVGGERKPNGGAPAAGQPDRLD
jgi:hypothetical protein